MTSHRFRQFAGKNDFKREHLGRFRSRITHHDALVARTFVIDTLFDLRTLFDDIHHNADITAVAAVFIDLFRDTTHIDVCLGRELARYRDDAVPAYRLDARAGHRILRETCVEDRV